MSIEPNYEKGTRYFWAGRSTLACLYIGIMPKSGAVGLFVKRPKNRKEYHRVDLVIIRTKREADRLNRQLARARAKYQKKLQAKSPITAPKAPNSSHC